MESLTLSLPRDTGYVTIARLTASSVAAKVGFDLEVIEDIKLSISEMCNLALASKQEGNYELEVRVGEAAMEVSVVVDEVLTQQASSDFSVNENGLGLFIIQTLMDEVTVTRRSEGLCELVMRKRLS